MKISRLWQRLNSFDTVLYQFLEAETSDITFMGRDQILKLLAFAAYPPFHFSFTVPVSTNLTILCLEKNYKVKEP